MGYRLFNVFSELIDHTPASAVLTITEGERRILEDELPERAPDEDVFSVLSFCNFLASTVKGTAFRSTQVLAAILPIDHFAFYRNTVERLVDAAILPFDAKARFDDVFATSLTGLEH